MTHDLLSIDLLSELDVVATRQSARDIAAMLGFKPQEQTSFATAVSELSRHAHRFGTRAGASFALRVQQDPALVVRISQHGNRGGEMTGDSTLGVVTARRLVDEFDVQPGRDESTLTTISKRLPRNGPAPTPELARAIAERITRDAPRGAVAEVQQQNRELIIAFEELQKRQAEVERLNAELAETNRGVLALYAELDEKAESLRRASEHKSRFLSDVTHELRTPLNAMISLSQLLLDRADGELTTEQQHQVSLIYRSASSLNEMVSDLLDIARIEAGKEDVRVSTFAISDVLSALRGMFRPLMHAHVRLLIDDGATLPAFETDERKLTQILRNLLSNSIKFTQAGEVALHVRPADDEVNEVLFEVVDTGIGIAPADLSRIFADFAQVDSPLQRSLRGTGLGLPLTRKLARMLGGAVEVRSETGVGSTFSVKLPRRLPRNEDAAQEVPAAVMSGAGDGGERRG